MKLLGTLSLGLAVVLADCAVASTDQWQAVAFMYHRFGDDRYPSTSINIDQFEAHLDHLQASGYTVWPLERIATHLQKGEPVPDRTVAITIDDAYQSVYEQAYPRLRARGLPYTVFVATDAVDDGQSSVMRWDQIREMQRNGASFANHSASHDYLVRMRRGETLDDYRVRIREDLERGHRRLEQELGKDNIPPVFAYPYGEYNEHVAAIAQAMGYVAFGQHSGAIGPHSDPRALPRFPMSVAYADIADFRQKAASKALPVKRIHPWNPIVGDNNPPKMRIELEKSTARLDQLACFVSLQGRAEPEWEDRDGGIFSVAPSLPLPPGRSRYNCTAPSEEPGRFHWFSQQWIVLPD